MRGAPIVAALVCVAGPAQANDEPMPAPANVSWYGTSLPAAPPAVRIRRPVVRDGVYVLAGATHAGETFGRIDVGIPTPTRHFGRLRTMLVFEMAGSAEQNIAMRTLAVAPALQYGWRLPITMQGGELVVVALAGLQRSQQWMKRPDEPFWPSRWESMATYALRLSPGLEYRGRRGLLVSVQAIAIAPIGDPEPPDPRWMVTPRETGYGASIVAGYAFK